MTTITLINPTDDELSAAVAKHVMHSTIKPHKPTQAEIESGSYFSWEPNYATSADAVLPLTMQPLNGRKFYFTANYLLDGWRVWIHFDPFTRHEAKADTLAKAICIALLRANGIEVETKP